MTVKKLKIEFISILSLNSISKGHEEVIFSMKFSKGNILKSLEFKEAIKSYM